MKAFLSKALASCGYLSYLPTFLHRSTHRGATGAGFIGSLAGLACARWLPSNALQTAIVLVGGLAMAVAVSDAAEEAMGHHDDPRIVIDEWLGYLVAVSFLPATWRVWLAGLVLFRLFDVWKPLGIRHSANLPGGWGIVMDDVVAGVYANLLLQAAHGLHWL